MDMTVGASTDPTLISQQVQTEQVNSPQPVRTPSAPPEREVSPFGPAFEVNVSREAQALYTGEAQSAGPVQQTATAQDTGPTESQSSAPEPVPADEPEEAPARQQLAANPTDDSSAEDPLAPR